MMSERMERAEARLKDNVWDIEAWQILVKEYSSKKLEDARSFYERLVTQFPLSGRYWKLYIDQEMKARNYTKVEQLFQRCLMKVLHIELWKCYLNYVKETKATLPTFREKMAQAYDFALEKIDKDLNSYSIWNDYVSFLKNVEAVGSYAENQKITAVRKVYQRGVVNPMMNIDQFWRDYIAYEHSINQMIAEKMVNDRSREYMNARRVAKDYEAITRGINRNAPALPPLSRPEDLKQLDLWRKYIAWEKSNPLRTEDTKEMVKRVIFAYEQCLLCMGHYPDIWYEYAAFLNENSQILSDKGDVNGGKLLQDQAAAVYDRAINGLLKTNMLIHFAYADFEEGRNKKEKSREIYERLLEVKEPKFDPTLVYIQFMKFSRRSEGIKAARAVFRRAREDERCEHHIYVCAAMMEFYCTKEKKVACNIFELGLKKYHANANYLAAYIDFLSHLNEENNARVVFEKVLTNDSLKPQDSIQIWNRFLQFESHIGDLSSVIKVEKRRAAVMTKALKVTSETLFVVDRYKFQDLLPCSPTELKSIGYSLKGSGANGLSIASPLSTMGMSVSSPTNTNSNSSSETPTTSNRVNPDLDQMIPFKPTMTSVLVPGSHSVPGGIFPPPPAVGQFLAQLPHPSSFHGPFVMVEELMNILRSSKLIDVHSDKLPPTIKPDSGATSGLNSKLFDTAVKASAHFAANFNSNAGDKSNSIKRAIGNEEDEDQDGENSNPANTPTFDIYRSRQLQKRVK